MSSGHSPALPLLNLRRRHFIYVTAHSTTLPPLYLRHSSFYNASVASPTSQALHLRHRSFSNPSAASSAPQLILQPFCCFTYVTGTSPTLPGEQPMYESFIRMSKRQNMSCQQGDYFINLDFKLEQAQKPSTMLRISFSNPFIASPTSQLFLQHFRRFAYVTARSTDLPLLHLRHRHFTYVIWRAAHVLKFYKNVKKTEYGLSTR